MPLIATRNKRYLQRLVLRDLSEFEFVDQMRKRVIELEGGHVIRDQVRGVYGYTG